MRPDGIRLTESEVLRQLRMRGATRLRRVHFRANRRTIWSLTQGGTVLNLHEGYRHASATILDHFALIVRHPRSGSPSLQRAKRAIREHPPLLEALRSIRSSPSARGEKSSGCRNRRIGTESRDLLIVGPNCATPAQQAFLNACYGELNLRRFGGGLPEALPVRLSRRMRSTWGWVTLGHRGGTRVVGELALNLDLMLAANDGLRAEVFLHELAHVEAWIQHGDRGHGSAWKAIARRVGCEPRARGRARLQVRARRKAAIHRVPPAIP